MRLEDIRPDGRYVLHILPNSTSVYGDSNEMTGTSGDSRLTSQSEEIRLTRALCSYSFSLMYGVGYSPNHLPPLDSMRKLATAGVPQIL
jgi:hypothetical protein